MLTTIILEGIMGRMFGREWKLAVDSPSEALRMIEANKPGLMNWIRQKASLYSQYQVICEHESGVQECLGEDSYGMKGRLKSIRFIPIIQGAGGVARIVIGAVLIASSTFFGPWAANLGWSLVIGGIAQLLSPIPDNTKKDGSKTDSYYFNGPTNTVQQGAPVPLIYGTVLTGSQAINAQLTIDQLMV